MSIFTNPILPNDPQGLNRLNANFEYLNDKTSALQQPPYVVSSQATMLALSDAVVGNIAIRTDITGESNQFMLTALPASTLANWMQLPMAVSPVNSVNGQTGNVVLDASDIIDSGTGQNISQSAGKANVAVLQADRLYPGADLAIKFAAEIATPAFNGNVWAWIQSRIRSGNYTGIHVGDFIQFTAAGNTIVAEVAGINTYRRYGSPEVPNHIDFISRDLWPESVQWNLVNYNNGLASMTSPYLVSNVHAFINSLQMAVPNGTGADPATITVDYRTTGIFSRLPAALQNVIVPKVTVLESRYTAGILLTHSNGGDWREIGPLWIPSEIEVCGTTMWGGTESRNQGWDSYGFQQYPIFAQNMKIVKGNGHNGARHFWWLLTAVGGFSTVAAHIHSNGRAGRLSTSYAVGRVPVCFRIA